MDNLAIFVFKRYKNNKIKKKLKLIFITRFDSICKITTVSPFKSVQHIIKIFHRTYFVHIVYHKFVLY